MVALTEDDLNLVGELLSERMGIPIPDFDSSAMSVAEEEDTEQATAAAPVMEKTTLDVKLVGFDAKSKIKVIKEVRAAFGGSLGLKEAKELVEGAPTILKKDMRKEEAQELQKKLEEIGATIELV
jgi:large subunit ribosomal protein L7/L12